MAFTIDPAVELLHAFSKRLTAKLIGIAASKLSPGRKVRVAQSQTCLLYTSPSPRDS